VLDIVAAESVARARVGRRRVRISYDVIRPLIALGDAVAIMLASIVGASGYQLYLTNNIGDVDTYLGLGVVGSVGYALSAQYLGLYRLPKLLQARQDYWQIIVGWIIVVLILAIVLFLFKLGNQVSRGSVIGFFLLAGLALPGWRKLAKFCLKKALADGLIRGRRALLVGTHDELTVISADHLLNKYGVEEVDRMILLRHVSTDFMSNRDLTAVNAAMDRAREVWAEEVVLALPWNDSAQLELMRNQFRLTPLPVRLVPDRFVRSVLELETASDRPTFLIEIQREPLTGTERLIKRVFDVVTAASLLLILSPLMLVIAVAIKLNSHDTVIFRQRRNGFNGQPFVIYKFRTMHVSEDGLKIAQAKQNDSRVTRLGRLIRQTSIDELPQLLNVLKGDMSIVGPRPHAIAHDDEYSKLIADYAFRRHVKPGMTGWAQVHGLRGRTRRLKQMDNRVKFDLWYINNWSFWLDLQIVVRTCVELMRERNAY
jgi:Undecaprenyl-phosphate glucose phosphotransferase